MPKLHWEDFKPGAVAIYGPRLVTREEIVAFAAEFDPQPMHLDEAAASATILGGLGASGWHTCCLLMRMIADGFLLDSSRWAAPGIEEVRWLKPLRPGTQHPRARDRARTPSLQSRPEMGLVEIPLSRCSTMAGASIADDAHDHADVRPPPAGGALVKFFEDIQVGDVFEVGRHTFTADDIKAFADRFDPQLFHVDEDAAARSHFGALCASGWHTALAWMRLMVDYRRAHGRSGAARAASRSPASARRSVSAS